MPDSENIHVNNAKTELTKNAPTQTGCLLNHFMPTIAMFKNSKNVEHLLHDELHSSYSN